MTAAGRVPTWRRRALMMALALMSALVFVPTSWLDSRADDTTSLTILYHGSVMGKIAPCG